MSYNNFLIKCFGVEVLKVFPREAVKFAIKYFGAEYITALEIGVLRGEHAESMLKNLNINRIYLIDCYEEYSQRKVYNESKEKDKAVKRLNKYENKNKKDKINWIFELSSNAIKKIKEKIDFIYIDGNHMYSFVKEDLENYYPMLEEGGIIAGHDIQDEEVSKAVIEFCNKNKIKLNIGDRRDWWFIK